MRLFEIVKKFPWIIPTIVFAILVVLGANMHPLWGDESETALFARNILRYGVPYGWDGVNIISLRIAEVLNKDLINNVIPWPQLYLAAGSFALFGESSFIARLPFTLVGIGTIPLLYYLSLRVTGSKRTSFLAVVGACLSVQYILYSFQARYYSLTVLSGILFLFASFSLDKTLRSKLFHAFSTAFFLYNNFVSFPIFYIAVLIGIVIASNFSDSRKDNIREFIFSYLVCGLIGVGLFLPWYLYLKPEGGRVIFDPVFPGVVNFLVVYYDTLSTFMRSNVLPSVFIIFLPVLLIHKFKKGKLFPLLSLTLIVIFYFIGVLLVSALVDIKPTIIGQRYHTVMFPLLFIIVAILFEAMWKWNKFIFGVVTVLFLTTNVFTLNFPVRSFLAEYLGEINNPYITPTEAVAAYLKEHSVEGDTAYVNIDRYHEPLMFGLDKKVKFVNRLPSESRIFFSNRDVLPSYLYQFIGDPDWIILFSKRELTRESVQDYATFDLFDYRSIVGFSGLENYEEIVLPVYFLDLTRPEMDLHSFKEIKPVYQDQVFIYKKKQI